MAALRGLQRQLGARIESGRLKRLARVEMGGTGAASAAPHVRGEPTSKEKTESQGEADELRPCQIGQLLTVRSHGWQNCAGECVRRECELKVGVIGREGPEEFLLFRVADGDK